MHTCPERIKNLKQQYLLFTVFLCDLWLHVVGKHSYNYFSKSKIHNKIKIFLKVHFLLNVTQVHWTIYYPPLLPGPVWDPESMWPDHVTKFELSTSSRWKVSLSTVPRAIRHLNLNLYIPKKITAAKYVSGNLLTFLISTNAHHA